MHTPTLKNLKCWKTVGFVSELELVTDVADTVSGLEAAAIKGRGLLRCRGGGHQRVHKRARAA